MSSRTYHTQKALTEQVLGQMSDPQWQEIIDLLPVDVSQQAFTHHAFTRANGLRCPTDLLRGIFASVFCFNSFREVGSWACSTGLSSNGARSWAKRTRQAAPWLLWMVQRLLVSAEQEEALTVPAGFTGQIHLVDATHLRTWKRNGESRRLHCSYNLLEKRLEQVVLTDHHVGEGLKHFHGHPGDIFVGDRASCRRQGLLDQLDAGVDVVTRLHWSTTPLLQADGTTPFDLSGWLKQREAAGEGEISVVIQVRARQKPMRLLALRLSQAAAKRAQRKRKAKARKNGCTSQALTIQVADWLLVLTSLSKEQWPCEQVLCLYRARWQIELLFKRIKQLVRLHRLRSENLQSNQAVLAAMLVGWILLEQQASHLRASVEADPSEADTGPVSSWALCAMLTQSLRTMIVGPWTWSQIRGSMGQMRSLLTPHPQQRPHHATERAGHLAQILGWSLS
jgi:Transposase DDE domain